ncbi:MAG TPA: Sjogren's syndrome/scleroderma autoantigen 1 family protein [Methanoregula sp.]|nr:Sjogren's syndrome/scleroderma autoantigen 1 family protein [Methanoregula sp.]
MAEHLLKGGKMLEKSCKTCGCPLFEVKGKTLCVVCAENTPLEKPGTAPSARERQQPGDECSCGEHHAESCEGGLLTDELAMTIVSLCERIQNEKDPDNVLALMNAVKAGTEALKILCQL